VAAARREIDPAAYRLAGAHFVSDACSNLHAPLRVAATRMEGWPLVVLLTAGGVFLQSTRPVNVTFAHQIAPVSAATVSSLMMGLAWGTGGVTAPLVGALADRVGVEPTLSLIACLPLMAALCAAPLPGGGAGDAAGHRNAGARSLAGM
jgi:fucose permease